MTPEQWIAYILASAVVLVIPGPTILLVLSMALTRGRRAALAAVPGVMLGDAVAITLSLAGLGAVLAASAQLFTAVKLLGACYLVYLGVRMWRAAGETVSPDAKVITPRDAASRAFLVTVLNPKSILFFVAFLPQFMNPEVSFAAQAAPMAAVFVLMGGLNAACYGLAGSGAGLLFRHAGPQKLLARLGGAVLMGAGLAAAVMERR